MSNIFYNFVKIFYFAVITQSVVSQLTFPQQSGEVSIVGTLGLTELPKDTERSERGQNRTDIQNSLPKYLVVPG